MRINHRRANVLVAQEFLHGANIVAIGQEVGGEGMAERVAGHALRQSGLPHSLLDRFLDERFMNVVPALFPGPQVHPAVFLGKHELPGPLLVGLRILASLRMGQFDAAVAVGQILLVN